MTEGPRIPPLEAPYEPQIEALLTKWMPPGTVEPLRLFRTLVVHEQLAGRMLPLGAGILGPGAMVPPADRELMIHRTCALTGAEYEWGVHARAFGEPLGFTAAQLASTVHGSWSDACWDARQSAVIRLADELHATSRVSDELWAGLRDYFTDEQLLELLITAGWYHVISFVLGGAAVELEPWAARFPEPESAAHTV